MGIPQQRGIGDSININSNSNKTPNLTGIGR
jgi:hypothetical protein